MSAKVPDSNCYKCNLLLDRSTYIFGDDVQPYPGCISVCLKCGSVLIFDHELKQRKPTGAEVVLIRKTPRAMRELRQARRLREAMRKAGRVGLARYN